MLEGLHHRPTKPSSVAAQRLQDMEMSQGPDSASIFNQLKAHEFKNMRYPTSVMPGDRRIPLPRLVGPLGQDPSYVEETRPRRKGREELAPGRGLILGLNLP